VFAVPDDTYRQLARRTAGTSLPADRGFLALFSFEVRGGAAVVDLRDYAPRDPAALQRMMSAGPVRFGMLAGNANGERAVRIEVSSSGEAYRAGARGHVSERPRGLDRPARPLSYR
jgi:hypothetical protein